MCPLTALLAVVLLACSGAGSAILIQDGPQLGKALASLASPGSPVDLDIRANLSLAGVGPLPVRVARDVTLRGAGAAPRGVELDLGGLVDAWHVEPGAKIRIENLTLSNLALRPPNAPSPPPANMSVFTWPLWFFQTNR